MNLKRNRDCFCRDTPLESLRPPNHCFPGWPKGPPDPCAQARIARATRKHGALMAKNMLSNHNDCKTSVVAGDCYDIHLIQRQYKDGVLRPPPQKRWRGLFVVSFAAVLNRVNILAITTILVLHVGVIGHHVPRH